MKRLTLLGLVIWLLPTVAGAQQTKAPDVWAPYKFLVGAWSAEGHGEPGEGKGGFTFRIELQGKILERRSRVDFPATPKRPAFSHEDLLVIYRDAKTTPDRALYFDRRAIYFDSEGFVIHYTASFSLDGKTLTFLSDLDPEAPRQRLTYVQNPDGSLSVKFEIAPPGKPDAFVLHVGGVAHRVGSKD